MIEKRKRPLIKNRGKDHVAPAPTPKSSPLPKDFLKMIIDVLNKTFHNGLQELAQSKKNPEFVVEGAIFPDEICLSAALVFENQLSATAVHASVDFDPKASAPTAEDLIGVCVDAVGGFFATLFDPQRKDLMEQVFFGESLSGIDGVPYEWTETKINKRKIFLRVDRANLRVDAMTDDWLKKNDPDYEELEKRADEEAAKLFRTGQNPDDAPGDDELH